MTDTAIAAAPFIALAQPYAVAIAGVLVPALIGWGVNEFSKWTGVKIDAALEAKVQAAAGTEAGQLIAAASDNLATAKIHVGSPVVASAASNIAEKMPNILKALGLDEGHVKAMVAGEVGKLQAQMTSVNPVGNSGPLPGPTTKAERPASALG